MSLQCTKPAHTKKQTCCTAVDARRLSLQNYLVGLLAEKAHWLAERDVSRVEVGMGFNKRTMKEMVAKQGV
jgi:hypothetical protein